MNNMNNKVYTPVESSYIAVGPLCYDFIEATKGYPFLGKGVRTRKDEAGRISIHEADHDIFMDRVLAYVHACVVDNRTLKQQMEELFPQLEY